MLTLDIQRLAKHGPCPTRASVFNQGMKEVHWDALEKWWRAHSPPPLPKSLWEVHISTLIYCARINVSTEPMDPREDIDGRKRSQRHKRYVIGHRAVSSSCWQETLTGISLTVHKGPFTPCEVIWTAQAVWSLCIWSQKITQSNLGGT